MKLSPLKTIFGLGLVFGALIVVPNAQCGPIIGGFDTSRGGDLSLRDSVTLALLRSSITSQFPQATFTASGILTSSYLSTINELFISSAFGYNNAISPLSAGEQSALQDFVMSGGTALIFVDNSTFDVTAPAANMSLLAPFGLHVTGTLGGFQSGTIINSANPVAGGPAGAVASISTLYPGWFDSLNGSLRIANLNANGAAGVAAYMPGALGAGSGGVVFFSDANLALDGTRTTGDTSLLLNSLALAPASVVPEPGTMSLLGVASLGILALRRKSAPRVPKAKCLRRRSRS